MDARRVRSGLETSRRRFLQAVGGALGAAALPFTGRGAAAGRRPDRYDVAVIGGGFAGVAAARELAQAGLRVVVLEARRRLGGRTFTVWVDGELFELGGMWVHSTQPHVWAEINRYGLELVETPERSAEEIVCWDGEQIRRVGLSGLIALFRAALCASPDDVTPPLPRPALERFALLDELLSEFHAEAPRVFPRPFDPFFSDGWRELDGLSIRDRLDAMDLGRTQRALLEGVLGAAAHGSFAEAGLVEMLRWWALSGSDLQRYSDSVARYRLREGTSSLIQAMLADGRPELRLGARVVRVAQSRERVEITVEGKGTLQAHAAVVAVPLNVLASVEFSPPLAPLKLAASRERHAARGVKVYVRVRGEVPQLLGLAPESEALSTLMTVHAGSKHSVLLGFGTDPTRLDVHDPRAVELAVRRFLPGVGVTETIAYDWHLDPFALGTWCVFRKGQMSRYLKSLREPQGRIYFAGSDFALGWRGFIDGAIESGTRVAREVIEALRGHPQARSVAMGEGAARPTGASSLAVGAIAPAQGLPLSLGPCRVCHDLPGAPAWTQPSVGPSLRGVVGRRIASEPEFPYSEALRRRRAGVWNEAELDAFLADPQRYAPGTAMAFGGIRDPRQRAAVIRALHARR